MKFLIGAATAAHQVEGNNIYSDCWAQENMIHSGFSEPSLSACDHYNRYKEDILLLKSAGLNSYRFSVEWARIEPEEGRFSHKEIEHYRDVLSFCREKGICPIVTLFHFSSPKWLIAKGGWEDERTAYYFSRYCAFVVGELGGLMEYVCTVNEANIGAQIAAMTERIFKQNLQLGLNTEKLKSSALAAEEENLKIFGVKNPNVFLSARSENGIGVIMDAHVKAREEIKKIYPHIKVGLTLSLHDFQGEQAECEKEWNEEFLRYVPYLEGDDFFGIQNYTRTLIGGEQTLKKTQMGYEIYPQALGNVIRRVNRDLKIPLIVTENGIATENDMERCEFIRTALHGVYECVGDGIPVLGYMYWSLLDNFEWQKGYSMNFGLISVDRKTMKRTPKESLYYLGSFVK